MAIDHIARQIQDIRSYGSEQFRKARLFFFEVNVDPVDGIERLDVYTDDGHGNGEQVFSVTMKDLEAAIASNPPR